MSNKLSKNIKAGDRFSIDAAAKKKAEEEKKTKAEKASQWLAQSQEKAGILNNWKVTTAINLVIAAVFIGLAIYRYKAGAGIVYIILLALFGLINLGCALWTLKNFTKGEEKKTG